MNTFEYITALVAVVVGLALVDIIASLNRLLRAGRRVKWDWVSPVAAALIVLELFNVWWRWRSAAISQASTLGETMCLFGVLVLLFLSASASLPDDVPEDGLDLGAYFDQIRRYFFIVYTAYVVSWIMLSSSYDVQNGATIASRFWIYSIDMVTIVATIAAIFIRRRWWSGIVLLGTLVWLTWIWWGMALR